jgi:hypothetical protein
MTTGSRVIFNVSFQGLLISSETICPYVLPVPNAFFRNLELSADWALENKGKTNRIKMHRRYDIEIYRFG